MKRRLKQVGRWLWRGLRWALVGLLLFVGVGLAMAWEPIGHMAEGERLERMKASPQWGEGVFENPAPLWNDTWGMLTGASRKTDDGEPRVALPVQEVPAERFDTPPSSGLRVTWLGHSTLLIEIGGKTFLTDPIWGERTSPLTWIGPKRWYAPPLALDALPDLDAVILSHDHYDHLDHPTIVALAAAQDVPFIMPLGVGSHLAYWGVPDERIVELDWWDEHAVGDVRIVCTPARHASGRQVFDQNHTLWAGYALQSPERRMFFSGDTGLFNELRDIGERLGPFDLAAIEVGAYDRAWPDWHMGPEQAVAASGWLKAQALLPVHWGLFDLAYHSWASPIERVLRAADDLPVAQPRPGETFEIDALPSERWWPDAPFETAEEDPICARRVEGGPCPGR
ncbi:MAG: MBL fold metallo-hydrolase [Myxococcota bacterium]